MFLETNREGEKQVETKASIPGLIAWLETKDPKGDYNWHDCKGACLVGQYVNAIGLPWFLNANGKIEGPGIDAYLQLINETHAGHIASTTPWTYGAALKRARAAQALND